MNKVAGKITRLWLTMIHVSDLDEAIEFYHEKLGLSIALEARKFNHVELGPDEPFAKIGLHAIGKKKRRKKRTGIVFDTDDIYAFYERLSEEGVRFTLKPTKMPWGGIVADFLDPDGNELEVVQDPEHYKRKYHQ
jgi:catechol 2,3-dioxygenase-like lactoylglutathione lyase family enzyme